VYSRAVALKKNRTSGRGVVKATERGRELSHIVALQTVPPSRWNDEAAAPPPCGDRDSRERDGNVLKADLIGSRGLHIKASEGGFLSADYPQRRMLHGLAESYSSTTINAGRRNVQAHQDPMGGGDGGGLRGCPLRCAKSYRIGVKAPLDRIDGVETCRVDDGQVAGVQRWVEPNELVFCVSVS
jgi:hypothetical protein